MNNPKLLILDEPTTGLDPQVRHLIWDKLRQLRAQGTTILLTTHYMEEAFQICDTVLIMDKGKKVLEDSPRRLLRGEYRSLCPGGARSPTVRRPSASPTCPAASASIIRRPACGSTHKTSIQLKSVADKLSDHPYYLRQTTLEDVFLKATGRALNEKQ